MRPRRIAALAAALAAAAGVAACAHRPEGPPPRPKVRFTSLPAAEAAKYANPHEGPEGKPLCQGCHATGAKDLPPVNPDPIGLCSDCHDVGRMRHPFRVDAPPEARGKALPLIGGRQIACHTCHDPHDLKARRAGLRVPYKELCVTCHVKHGKTTVPPGHPPTGGAAPDQK